MGSKSLNKGPGGGRLGAHPHKFMDSFEDIYMQLGRMCVKGGTEETEVRGG